MDYVERQKEWLKNSGVKEGDKVLVVGNPEWDDYGQGLTVGMVGTVMGWRNRDDMVEGGILVTFGDRCPCGNSGCGQGYYYPFYLLTKVEND